MPYKLLFSVLLLIAIPTYASSDLIKVGIINHTPFSMIKDNKPSGLAIDIWKTVAKTNNWHYQFTPIMHNLNEGLEKLVNGDIDVLIGAIPVDKRGLSKVEFSRPYFINKVGLVVKDTRKTFLDYMWTIFSFISLKTVLIFLAIFILFSHVIWYLERGKTIPEQYIKGVLISLWFAIASFMAHEKKPEPFSKEFRPAEPIHYVTRIIIFFWLLASATILATLFASITSSLTMALSDTSKVYRITDFRDKKVVMVEDTDFVIKRSFKMRPTIVSSFDDAMKLLNNNQVFAIIEDIPTARYELKKEQNKDYMITNVILGYNELAFAFRNNSKLRRQFDITFDKLKESDQIESFCSHYLYMDGAMFCEL